MTLDCLCDVGVNKGTVRVYQSDIWMFRSYRGAISLSYQMPWALPLAHHDLLARKSFNWQKWIEKEACEQASRRIFFEEIYRVQVVIRRGAFINIPY